MKLRIATDEPNNDSVWAHPAAQDRAAHEPSQSSLSRPSGEHPLRGHRTYLDIGPLVTSRTHKAPRPVGHRQWLVIE